MNETRRKIRRIRLAAIGALAIGLASTVLGLLAAAPSAAATKADDAVVAGANAEEAELSKKAEWQDRYRTLRNNSVRMRDNATKLRKAYSQSQHANYPRGGARERFKQQVLDTERKADQYEVQLAQFVDEARQNQIPPGWLYEVDDEPVDPGTPAAAGGDDDTHSINAPDGRNPAYYNQSDESDDAEAAGDDEDLEDDRGASFSDFNDDRDDQYEARDPGDSNDDN